MASLVVLSVDLIPLIVRTDTDHRNSEIYRAIQIGVLQPWTITPSVTKCLQVCNRIANEP